jgi:uncharacterized membrane protein
MFICFLAFLIGVVCGLRAVLGLAAVSCSARLQHLHLEDTWLAFLGYAATPYVLAVMALGEIVNDKLPKTPSRTLPPSFIARVVTGSLAGAAIGASNHLLIPGLLVGALGSVIGTLGGARARAAAANLFGKDLPAALLEDAVGLGLALFVVLS